MLLTMEDFPLIRYAADTPRAKDIAFQVHARLQDLKRKKSSLVSPLTCSDLCACMACKIFWVLCLGGMFYFCVQFKQTSNPATLLVLDRGHDAVSALLHEFSYQAMIMDVLDGKGNTLE